MNTKFFAKNTPFLALCALLLTGCEGNKNYWDSSTGALKYNRSGRPLWETDENPRMVETEEDFLGPAEEEFIALAEEDLHPAYNEDVSAQPLHTPGERGSPLPSLASYQRPSQNSAFQSIFFSTDVHVIKRPESKEALEKIADQMKRNHKIFIYVEGNCDERGSEAYNQALGTRRANSVRQYLINRGVSADRIHTISYGKEKPMSRGHDAASWQKNRRTDFKIYNLK